jgi:Mg2+ and Co2+ transporter CorA
MPQADTMARMTVESGEDARSSTVEALEPDQVAVGTVWIPGHKPAPVGLDIDLLPGVLRWFDVSACASLEALFERLEPHCNGLEPEMLQELLVLDDLPQGHEWNDGKIRLASTFGIYPQGGQSGAEWGLSGLPSPNAIYQAVELLAGDDWLITKWHDPCLYCGSALVATMSEPVGKDPLFDAVARRWVASRCQSAGDLGVMAMHELSLTYAPAYRAFRTALEEWEMRLYGLREQNVDGNGSETEALSDPEVELRDLWGARARFRDWLTPLNVSGLNGDIEKAWLPAENHEEVKKVDERVDRALAGLRRLGDTLRSSFQLVHIQKAEAQREHRERLQRRVEIIATVFLVPTLVVGFFGANTWVPGEHRQSGLEGMVMAMVLLTLLVIAVLWATQRRHDAKQVAWHEKRLPS